MKATPLKILLAGTAIILLTNAVTLIGVYFNRSGEPESRITLSQRELAMPWGWRVAKDNSGLALGLNWRVSDGNAVEYAYDGFSHHGGTPEWLDEPRMKALGFDVAVMADDTVGRRRFERQLPRDVLLVLELAGPAWQKALERARQNSARHEAARKANADSKEFIDKAKRAMEQLQIEENTSSRLFAIDAGLERSVLRTRYPDRNRFLIVKATLRPRLETRDRKSRITGYVSELAVKQINVPHVLRPGLERLVRKAANDPARRFEATLAVGQRLEPWIESVRVAP